MTESSSKNQPWSMKEFYFPTYDDFAQLTEVNSAVGDYHASISIKQFEQSSSGSPRVKLCAWFARFDHTLVPEKNAIYYTCLVQLKSDDIDYMSWYEQTCNEINHKFRAFLRGFYFERQGKAQ